MLIVSAMRALLLARSSSWDDSCDISRVKTFVLLCSRSTDDEEGGERERETRNHKKRQTRERERERKDLQRAFVQEEQEKYSNRKEIVIFE